MASNTTTSPVLIPTTPNEFVDWKDDEMTLILLPIGGGILLFLVCFSCICCIRRKKIEEEEIRQAYRERAKRKKPPYTQEQSYWTAHVSKESLKSNSHIKTQMQQPQYETEEGQTPGYVRRQKALKSSKKKPWMQNGDNQNGSVASGPYHSPEIHGRHSPDNNYEMLRRYPQNGHANPAFEPDGRDIKHIGGQSEHIGIPEQPRMFPKNYENGATLAKANSVRTDSSASDRTFVVVQNEGKSNEHDRQNSLEGNHEVVPYEAELYQSDVPNDEYTPRDHNGNLYHHDRLTKMNTLEIEER